MLLSLERSYYFINMLNSKQYVSKYIFNNRFFFYYLNGLVTAVK